MEAKHLPLGSPDKEPMSTGIGIAGKIYLKSETTLAGTSSM